MKANELQNRIVNRLNILITDYETSDVIVQNRILLEVDMLIRIAGAIGGIKPDIIPEKFINGAVEYKC